MTGEVKWFNNEKGCGFITTDDGTDIFVHYSGIVKEGYKTLKEGENVIFEVEDTEKDKQAKNVKTI